MIHLTDDAKKRMDDYLQQVRAYLEDCSTVDAEEVQQNIEEHIESELRDSTEPVSYEVLDLILKKLGSPRQWVPQEDISWWRKIILRWRTDPQDWRLAYVSFIALVLSVLFFLYNIVNPAFVFMGVSFIFSRVVLSVIHDENELKAQKWLVYPSLIIVYATVLFFLLFWLAPVLVEVAGGFTRDNLLWGATSEMAFWSIAFMMISAAVCLWCIIIGLIYLRAERLFHVVFRPFAQKIKRNWVKWFTGIALGLLLVFSAMSVLMIRYHGWQRYLE